MWGCLIPKPQHVQLKLWQIVAYPACLYIPQPRHSLVDVIIHSYGIRPGQEPYFTTLLDYLLALNASVKNPRMALGSQAPRTLDFISHDPDTILCMDPNVVKARIRQVVNGGGGLS